MNSISCYACFNKNECLKPWDYQTRAISSTDVVVDIMFSGICGSDLHTLDNDWKSTIYPVVPGHEIIGRVAEGTRSTKHQLGSIVGIGPQVYSCGSCSNCSSENDPLCPNRVFTYSDRFIDNSITYGGYAKYLFSLVIFRRIVVNEEYAIKIPDGMDLSRTAPLLCAGSTVFAPLRSIPKGSKVAIIGIGGLGHLAIQFSKNLGHEVSAISHSPSKEREAISLGADVFITTENISKYPMCFDYIITTSSHGIDNIDHLLQILNFNGSLILLGIPKESISFTPSLLIQFGRKITSSLILGKNGMSEMLQFAKTHSIYPCVEMFNFSLINEAIESVRKGNIRYRAVLKISPS